MTPVARPLAQITGSETARTRAASGRISAPKDQAVLPLFSRISSRQLDQIQEAMSPTDLDVLFLVQQLRLVTGSQLRRCFWPAHAEPSELAARRARRALHRLGVWRVIDRTTLRAAGGRGGGSESFSWCVGPAGLRLLARLGHTSTRLGAPGDRYVRHTLAISDLVTGLIESGREGLELISWESEPTCWRGYLSGYGSRLVLKPDLFLRLGAGHVFEQRIFAELDMATEAPATVAGKLRRYISYARTGSEQNEHGVFPIVLWFVPDARRREVLLAEIGRLTEDEQKLFDAATHEDAVSYLIRLSAEVPR